jgi:hypothetical protein
MMPKTHPWPADKVERWDVSRLKPYPQNPRLHPAGNIAEIRASIERYGFTMPVLVDEAGEVIAGAGRLEAARQLGLTEVPVIVARAWTDTQKRSYRIVDNSVAMGSVWSPDLLKVEFEALKLENDDLTLFTIEPELLMAMDGAILQEEPRSPQPPIPKTKTTIFVTVSKTRADEARNLIAKALKRAGIDHNL